MNKVNIKSGKVFNVLNLIRTPKYKLKANGETRTDPRLVDQILDSIPEEVWQRGGSFIDPCCGRGTIILKIIDKLSKYHSNAEIFKMINAVDIDAYCVFTTKEIIARRLEIQPSKLDKTVVQLDFLSDDMIDKKYDVVIGNPPYHSGNNSKGNKLWPKFIVRCYEFTKDNGFTCCITPTGWSSGGTNIPGGIGIIKDVFAKSQVLIINVDKITQKYFSAMSIEIGYFILHKVPVHSPTKLELSDGVVDVDFRKVDFISPRLNAIDIDIVNKVFFSGHPRVDAESFDRKITRGKVIEKFKKTKKHKFEHWVLGGTTSKNAAMIWLDFENSPNLKYPKILFNIGNRYWQPYYDLTGINVAAQGFAIRLQGNETIEALTSIFESKLLSYISWWYQIEMKGFMKTNIVKSYPKLDFSVIWTDDEIYKFFNISEDEQKHIERVLSLKKYN